MQAMAGSAGEKIKQNLRFPIDFNKIKDIIELN